MGDVIKIHGSCGFDMSTVIEKQITQASLRPQSEEDDQVQG